MKHNEDINEAYIKQMLSRIEFEMAHTERMRNHKARMRMVQFGLAYAKSVEAFPIRLFGEVVFVVMN